MIPAHRRAVCAAQVLLALGTVLLRGTAGAAEDERFARLREEMVATQIAGCDVRDERVLAAMRAVPRHRFVPDAMRPHAYADRPLPIGDRQTISQPYIVAKMTELLELEPDDVVFELGTGSGYQAAVASHIAARVYTVEILPGLAESARTRLAELGYDNVEVRSGDGMKGWPEAAPFDALIATAALPEIPKALVAQLAAGGRAVMPIGEPGAVQTLVLLVKTESGEVERRDVFDVRFVPLLRPSPGSD